MVRQLLSAVSTAGMVLGLWAFLSIAVTAPLIVWLRLMSLANERRTRDGRLLDWIAAVKPTASS